MFALKKLNSFCIQKFILSVFYNTFNESVSSFSFLWWFASISIKNRLQNIVRTCSEITGVPLRSLTEFYGQQVIRKAKCIMMNNDTHPLHFETMPSGRRLRIIKCLTNKYKFTFEPEAIHICSLNFKFEVFVLLTDFISGWIKYEACCIVAICNYEKVYVLMFF